MKREELIISALVDLVSAKELAAAVIAENHKENIKNFESKIDQDTDTDIDAA